MRLRSLVPALALLGLACLPHEVPPGDLTGRLPPPDVTPRVGLDPVEAARLESLWRISMLEITRPATPEGFAAFLANPEASIRAGAAMGVGRSGEALAWAGGDAAAFTEKLLPVAGDKSPEVRSAVAVAIGLIGEAGRGKIEAPFAAEHSPEVREKWVAAAGRVMALGSAGNAAEMELLRASLEEESLAPTAAFALGAWGVRCVRAGNTPTVPAPTLAALKARFEGTAGTLREPYAYALWRLEQVSTSADLRSGLVDPDPRVRAWCARGLAAIPGTHARREVGRLLHDSNVWTRVEAAHALPGLADADSTSAVELVDLLEHSDPPPSTGFALASKPAAVAALEALGDLQMRGTAEAVRARLTTDDPFLFAAVATAYVKVAAQDAVADLDETLTDRSGAGAWRFRKSVADALSALPRESNAGKTQDEIDASKVDLDTPAGEISNAVPFQAHSLFQALLSDPDGRVASAALDAYAEVAGVSARARLVAALNSSSDIAFLGTAADRLATLGKDAGPAASPALVAALSRFTASSPEIAVLLAGDAGKLAGADAVPALEAAARSPDDGLMLAAAKALRALGHTPPVRTAPPAAAVPLAEFIAAADFTRATLITKRGEVKLELRPDVAPLTVLHMQKLAAKGFFKGIVFHRVVPAFVVQGGDPRSDGWGGSDASIPCELSDLPYDTGALGMALSGRDTGDSQFFFALTPQPHLAENYTVLGRVIHGQDVLDGLEVGDVVEDLTFP